MEKIIKEIQEKNLFEDKYRDNPKLVNRILQNKKQIKFLTLDPFNHLEYKEELGEKGKITSDVIEYLLIKLSKKFSGKKIFFKVLTPGNYIWALGSPFDDIIIAYSSISNFDINEAGIIFSKKEETF